MTKPQTTTRRRALGLLAATPFLLLPTRSAFSADARDWSATGARVPKLDGLDAAMERLMRQYDVRAGSLGMSYFEVVKQRVLGPLGIDDVFPARTSKDLRLPGEPVYEQPGTGLTPEFPDQDIRVPLPYGGENWVTESKEPNGGLAATSGAVARAIGHYAVWGFGVRPAKQTWTRLGDMAGTTCYATSRKDGLDFCFVVNTRNFNGAEDAPGDTAKAIDGVLDSAQKL